MARKIDDLFTGYDVEMAIEYEKTTQWVFAGQTLDDSRTLDDYKIISEDTIRMTSTLDGGGKPKTQKSKESDHKFAMKMMVKQQRVVAKQDAFLEMPTLNPEVVTNLNLITKQLGEAAHAGNALPAIEHLLTKLPSSTLDEMLRVTHKDFGGNTDWKLKHTCMLFFGQDGKELGEWVDKLSGIKEGIETVYDWTVNKASDNFAIPFNKIGISTP